MMAGDLVIPSNSRNEGAILDPIPHRNTPPLRARSRSFRERICSGVSPASELNFDQQKASGKSLNTGLVETNWSCHDGGEDSRHDLRAGGRPSAGPISHRPSMANGCSLDRGTRPPSGGKTATMSATAHPLRQELHRTGIAYHAIDAVWPEWWTPDAEASLSANADLRYTLARRLGLAPRSLFDGPPQFIWRDSAKFKNLGTATAEDATILTSFGVAVGSCALSATRAPANVPRPQSPLELRQALLASFPAIGLDALLTFCWAIGIPVLQLHLFPLGQKRMHALTVRSRDRFAILIGRESRYSAQIAYFIAHEIGHIMLGHVDRAALLEYDDPLKSAAPDQEESAADQYALELLTGDAAPRIESTTPRFTASQLALAVLQEWPTWRVDPGILALCLAHSTGRWRQGFGALKIIPPGESDVGEHINRLARDQLELERLPDDGQEYLSIVLKKG